MPVADNLPAPLRIYAAYGLLVEHNGDKGTTDCPFCGREGKMGISLENDDDGRFRCVVCEASGNPIEFLRQFHKHCMETPQPYEWIENHRGIDAEILKEWGVCRSILTGQWLVPGYLPNGNIGQLYRYVHQHATDTYILYAAPILKAAIFGYHFYDAKKEHVYWCEGPWDAMVLRDRLKRYKRLEDGTLAPTSNESLSLAANINVLATPGATTFLPSWVKVCDEKIVTLLFDNDYPRTNNGKKTEPAGFTGLKHATNVLVSHPDDHPKEINYLHWSNKGYTEDYGDGYDVRDMLSEKSGSSTETLDTLFSMLKIVPKEWTEGKGVKHGANKGDYIKTEECKSWKQLVAQWERAAQWTPELNGALAVLLASVASVPALGEQLWIRLISPPSTFKSKLCSAIAVARKYTVEDDGMNGFFSGYNDAKKGEEVEDRSLISRLYYKTLITKEGATLVDSPMRDVIISQARAVYDGQVSKSYNNGLRWEHHGLRCTWILAGTPGMRVLDKTELGQRFIDYVIMEDIEPEMERSIMGNSLRKQLSASRIMSNGKVESTIDAEYLRASKLTGGYIDHLRTIAEEQITKIEVSDRVLDKISNLATFAEYMRARPSTAQEESADRALGTRIGGQLLKLAQYLALVMEKNEVDKEVMAIVRKVALDTSKGRTLDIIEVLKDAKVGLSTIDVSRLTNQNKDKENLYLSFLRRIKAVEIFDPSDKPSLAKVGKWRLTKTFLKLYRDVMRGS